MIKLKLYSRVLLWLWRFHRARKFAKKISRTPDRYDADFKNTYVLKQVKKFLKTINVQVSVIGFENLPKSSVLLAPNHASSFDSALIILALENPNKTIEDKNKLAVFLGKKELKKQKKFVGYFEILNSFFVDRQNPRSALKIIEELGKFAEENGRNVVIFPEGTRSKDGKLGEFRAGAFRIAKKEFMSIVPVTINNSLSISDFSRKGKLKTEVIFHQPMKPMTFISQDTSAIANRVHNKVMSALMVPEGKRDSKENTV